MIGALAIKNRRKKQALKHAGQSSMDQSSGTEPQPELPNFRTKCHFLYISAGVCALISIIVLIPAFFGNPMFYIYSGSFFGAAVLLFILACLLHNDPRQPTPLGPDQQGQPGNTTSSRNDLNRTTSVNDQGFEVIVEKTELPDRVSPSVVQPQVAGHNGSADQLDGTDHRLPTVTAS